MRRAIKRILARHNRRSVVPGEHRFPALSLYTPKIMEALAAGLSYVDINFQNLPGIIATAVVHDGDVALIDPGPSTSLHTLELRLAAAGIGVADVRAVLLTHIHFDHAGATGALLARNPDMVVYVHERGASHLVHPDRLVASAARLMGDRLDRVWGDFKPVPATAIKVLHGGETILAGGRQFAVEYTPGHASHHVSYLDRSSGVAFVGDVAAMQLVPGGYVLPPAPPPDIDLELWRASVARIGRWSPDCLFLTHFGPAVRPRPHLSAVLESLVLLERLVSKSLVQDASDADRTSWFIDEMRNELHRHMHDADVKRYEAAGRLDWTWLGVARYLRTRALNNVAVQ